MGALEENYPHIPHVKEVVSEFATKPMQTALYFSTGEIKPEMYRHYALNVPFYTHFTSPIRRYADLQVHRLLHAALTGDESQLVGMQRISQIAKQCNDRKLASRKAQDASLLLYLAVSVKSTELRLKDCVVTEL